MIADTSVRINGVKIHNFYVPAGGDVADRDVNRNLVTKLILWMK